MSGPHSGPQTPEPVPPAQVYLWVTGTWPVLSVALPRPWDAASPQAEHALLPPASIQRESQEVAAVSSWAEIHTAARLLRVPPERLEGAVTRRVMVSLGVLGKGGLSRPPKGSGSPGVGLGPGAPPAHSLPSGDALWPGLEIPAHGKRH